MLEINTTYLGDCLKIIKYIDDKSIDLIITDPPYEIENMIPYYNEMYRVLKTTGSIYIFGNKNMVADKWFTQFQMLYKDLLIWHYINSPKPKGRWRGSMQSIIYGYNSKDSIFNENEIREEYLESTKKLNGRERPSLGRLNKKQTKYDTSKGALPRDVIKVPALLGHLSKERVGHPDQKPLELIEKLMKASSNADNLILDCFAGSGTSGIAAKNLGRNYILIEKEKKYFDIIKERLGEKINA